MGDLPSYNNGQNEHEQKANVPKPEILDYEFPPESISYPTQDDVASSSGPNLRSSFIGMGFSPALVSKVIEEKGEDDFDMLLETLIGYPETKKADSQSSDFLDSLFGDENDTNPPEVSKFIHPKEETGIMDEGVNDRNRAALLMMNFSINEVDFALDKLGKHALIDEVVDFIVAAQIAENFEKERDDTPHEDEGRHEDDNDETLYGTMDKTLCLLEMGFSENEVSLAIEKFGSDTPISELADSIVSGKIFSNCPRQRVYDAVKVKTEDFCPDVSQTRKILIDETNRGKRPKEEDLNNFPDGGSRFQLTSLEENHKGKRPKQEVMDDSISFLGSSWLEEKVNPNLARSGMQQFKSNPYKSMDKVVAKPPFFFYGNVVNISGDSWIKISQFLYSLEPEFVNTQNFSALSRKEGYVHNLPTMDRFHILPRPPMTVQDTIPHTKKWWPSWDTRKQLSNISSDTSGISPICDRLERLLIDSRGVLSLDQQRDILHRCQTLNLIWVGPYKLGPVDPGHLERILGYPSNHTQVAGSSLTQRLESLRQSFQIDTLGYHLSVLKSLFPAGLTMLSVFSGVGGAEIALHRLGIKLKGVISVETSEENRRILKRWWEGSGQTGELLQIEDIQTLSTKKVQNLIEKFGSIDFVICQNSVSQLVKHPITAAGRHNLPSFDFTLFYEFVRLVQCLRSIMQRKR